MLPSKAKALHSHSGFHFLIPHFNLISTKTKNKRERETERQRVFAIALSCTCFSHSDWMLNQPFFNSLLYRVLCNFCTGFRRNVGDVFYYLQNPDRKSI